VLPRAKRRTAHRESRDRAALARPRYVAAMHDAPASTKPRHWTPNWLPKLGWLALFEGVLGIAYALGAHQAVFGLALVTSLLVLVGVFHTLGTAALTLDPHGITVRRLWWTERIAWGAVGRIELVARARGFGWISVQTHAGPTMALPDVYDLPLPELRAELLRRRAAYAAGA
jgi:hypothetical protein